MATAKKPAAPVDLGIGAPFGPTWSFKNTLKPTAAQKKKAARKQLKTTLDAHDSAIFKKRQDAAEKAAIRARVAATSGLPDAKHPFSDQGVGLLPSRDTTISDKTAKTAIAREARTRRQQGGLAPPETQKAAQKAQRALATSRSPTFADRHQLPSTLTGPDLGQLEYDMARNRFVEAQNAAAAKSKAKQSHHGGIGGFLRDAVDDAIPNIIASALPAGSTGAKLAQSPTWQRATATKHSGLLSGFGEVKLGGDANFVVPRNFLSDSAYAATGGKNVTYKDLASEAERYGEYSLTPDARKPLVEMAKAQGYNIKDAPTWNDPGLIARAFTPYKHSVEGFLRNAATDLAAQGAIFSAPPMVAEALAQSIQQRSATPAARLGGEFAQGIINLLPGVGDRPWLENVYQHPWSEASIIAPAAKGAGTLAGRTLGLSAERDVTLPSLARLAAQGEDVNPVRPVAATRNVLTRPAGPAVDWIMRGSRPASAVADAGPIARGRAFAGRSVEARRTRQVAERERAMATLAAGHTSHVTLNNYLTNLRNLPVLRNMLRFTTRANEAESLIYHSSLGSTPDEMARFFRSEADATRARIAEREGAVTSARTKYERDQAQKTLEELHDQLRDQEDAAAYSERHPVDIENLTPKQRDVVEAARKVANQTTEHLRAGGQIDERGQLAGELMNRAMIVHRTADSSSPEWQAADRLLALREEHNVLRARLHSNLSEADLADLPSSADIHSNEAMHQLFRWRQGMRYQALAGAEDTVPPPMLEQARTTAEIAGVDPAKVGRLGDVVTTYVARTRERIGRNLDDARARVAEQERREKTAHFAREEGKLQRLQVELENARARGRGATYINELETRIKAFPEYVARTFEPSRTLLRMQRQVERIELARAGVRVELRNPDRFVRATFTPDEIARMGGIEHLRRIAQSVADHDPGVSNLRTAARGLSEDAATRFRNETGKDVEIAHRYGTVGDRYTEELRAFHQMQAARAPYHMHLHRPQDPISLAPVQPSQGLQLPGGDFTHDVHLFLARDLDGRMRQAVAAEMFDRLSKTPFVYENTRPGMAIPEGWAVLPRELWENVKRSGRNPEQVRELARRLGEVDKKPPTHLTWDDEGSVLITNDMRDWIRDTLRLSSEETSGAFGGFLAATNVYRRWMLLSLPRTFVNNLVGNTALAALFGSGPVRFFRAMNILMRHPERAPSLIRNKGPITNAIQSNRAKVFGYQAFWRNANTFAEDMGNLMVYLRHAQRAFRKENATTWRLIGRYGDDFVKFLEDAAEGKNPNVTEWLDRSTDAFGKMFAHSKYDRSFATLFLFHRWVGHMLKLTLYTMPVKYPGRNLFLNQTAKLADEYRKEHGVFPDWAASFIPLWEEIVPTSQGDQAVRWALSTLGVNPFTTATQTFDFGSVGNEKAPLQALLASNINPLLRLAFDLGTGKRLDTLDDFRDYKGDPTGALNLNVALAEAIAALPIANTIFPRAGLSDDSVQIPYLFEQHPRYTSAGAADPTMRSPTPYQGGFWWGVMIRALNASGVPLRPLDAKGPRSDVSAEKTAIYMANQYKQSLRRQAKVDAAKSEELWQKDPEAWRKSKYNTSP